MSSEKVIPTLSKQKAKDFVDKWQNTEEEIRYAQSFWTDFFQQLCGVNDEKIAGIEFQYPVKSDTTGRQNWIDVYWKNIVLIEHKSKGEDLDKAEFQARGYLRSLPKGYQPKTIIICDFATFRIIDVRQNRTHEFLLKDLPKNIHRFDFIVSGNRPQFLEDEIEVDQKAAKLMANMYIELENNDYTGHETSVFLSRLLFLLFGDDTNMWEHNLFKKILFTTAENGSDVGETLSELFEFLNTPNEKRKKREKFNGLPYVNGGIFAESIEVIKFNGKMRAALIDAANYDWSSINPTIFGALFQLIKSKEERGALGEHYTSEENINKIVYPLFLDKLQDRLTSSWNNKKELKALRLDLGKIKLLDPACGCGNFLVVSYKHLRQIELELIVRLQELDGKESDIGLDGAIGLSVGLHQLFGIEILEWPAQVARIALFLTDHQQNLKLKKITGDAPSRFPVTDSATIINDDALKIDWNEIVKFDGNLFILGNPPFLGSSWQSTEQRNDTKKLWGGSKGSSSLDYVANWYLIATKCIKGTQATCAFVSTNSITQGEQPAALWSKLGSLDIYIDFAHQSFSWTSDAAGKAAVHCVIIGFSAGAKTSKKELWIYDTPNSAPRLKLVDNINAYLLDAPNVLVFPRSKPLNPKIQQMRYGNMPNEFGYLANIYDEDLVELKANNDLAIKFIRPVIGAAEMLQDKKRYCLWLVDATPSEMNSSKFISERVEMVRKLRSESKRKATVALAKTPYLFQEVREQLGDYLAVPIISSETREYIPMKIFKKDVVPTNALLTIPSVEIHLFAVLQSKLFSLWLRTVGGKLESRLRISAEIVYNNFPFPDFSNEAKDLLTESGLSIINTREIHIGSSLADMYVPSTMPKNLRSAHNTNDALVLSLFDLKKDASDEIILEKLFKMYSRLFLEDALS